ncbi:hypothetical protein ACOL3G_10355 [Aliarcobacter butzleri]
MFYNSKRQHSFLDFISPNEFEKRYNPSLFKEPLIINNNIKNRNL